MGILQGRPSDLEGKQKAAESLKCSELELEGGSSEQAESLALTTQCILRAESKELESWLFRHLSWA